MKVLNYRVTLLEPALVTALLGDPNSGVAFDYLPGSVLRGVLIGRYSASQPIDASDSTQRRLFFDGTTRYLNGYPLDVSNRPSRPVPLSWQRIKDKEDEISDFAVVEASRDDRQQWQRVRTPFYTRSREAVRLIQPERNLAVHTQRTARFGRAVPRYHPTDSRQWLETDEIPGEVYRYDALAAGQTFQAAIICDNDDDASILQKLLGGHVILGGSRSGGYGRAEIQQIDVNESANREEFANEDDEDTLDGKLIVTLQSDALLRDERGQFAVDAKLLGRVLSKHLDLKTELEPEDAFLGAETIGGFNRKWRLPLPQTLAMRMGSVLVFKDPGCDSTLLHNLEVRGIGERRTEGFGRIAFNRQRTAKITVVDNTREVQDSSDFSISKTEVRSLAGLMVGRMLRQRLDRRLLAAANGVTIRNPPSNAQLSRLRNIVIEVLRKVPPDVSKILRFIKSIEERGSARRQFARSIVDNKPMLRWLKDLLPLDGQGTWMMTENEWRDLLRLSKASMDISIGNVQANIDDALRLEYVLRFIDLVLAHAAQQRGKEN